MNSKHVLHSNLTNDSNETNGEKENMFTKSDGISRSLRKGKL